MEAINLNDQSFEIWLDDYKNLQTEQEKADFLEKHEERIKALSPSQAISEVKMLTDRLGKISRKLDKEVIPA